MRMKTWHTLITEKKKKAEYVCIITCLLYFELLHAYIIKSYCERLWCFQEMGEKQLKKAFKARQLIQCPFSGVYISLWLPMRQRRIAVLQKKEVHLLTL